VTLRSLSAAADNLGIEYTTEAEEVSPRISLSGDWEAYLHGLDKDRRHEVRRKRRRLDEAGPWSVEETTPEVLDRDLVVFFDLHRKSSRAKDDFLVGPVERFFRHICRPPLPQWGVGGCNLDEMEFSHD
jgi:CelD/BcsL family acetyltransferase involved in cellulose biosynthesis